MPSVNSLDFRRRAGPKPDYRSDAPMCNAFCSAFLFEYILEERILDPDELVKLDCYLPDTHENDELRQNTQPSGLFKNS